MLSTSDGPDSFQLPSRNTRGYRYSLKPFYHGVIVSKLLTTRVAIQKTVSRALENQPIVDMHTHLYPPTFGTPDPNKSGKMTPPACSSGASMNY